MSENGYVSRKDLFAEPPKRRYVDATVTGIGKVRLRSLTAADKAKYDSAALDSKGRVNTKALLTANSRLIILCVADTEGNPLFADGDIDRLQSMDSGVIERLAEECGRHCGITEEPEKN